VTTIHGLLVFDGIIRPVASASALTLIIGYIYYWHLQFLNHAIIIKTKVLLPLAYVTLVDFGLFSFIYKCRGKNKKLTALKSNSNTVRFNFQTYIIFSINLVSKRPIVHVSAEALATGRMIPSKTNSPCQSRSTGYWADDTIKDQ
jgi:hypothetical protein